MESFVARMSVAISGIFLTPPRMSLIQTTALLCSALPILTATLHGVVFDIFCLGLRRASVAAPVKRPCTRHPPDRRSVIGAPIPAGNVVAEMPVLLSDGPCRWVDDEEKQDDQDPIFRRCYVTFRADRIAGLGAAHDRRARNVCVLPSQWRSRHRIGAAAG